ncbi:phosphoglycerate mutase family [Geomicrobium sp. JCM 19037]|uniref:histidine phosphatase family protein n=1 Tax=unclassified Geomicrobium TaxID=2628951 RepID=UPI00045F32C0|nr:histidine phosphatase family protein [Geomicrobium sp. JCM 19037]GAK01923.1 phosphoglycerate mutase family [Geomicrobium sp. JCM 19037]
MTTIGFIRHGRTAWNHTGRAQGSSDIPLDEEGIVTAERLRERLRDEQWDHVYASDLRRAYQTADIASGDHLPRPIHTDERLREIGGGLIEGTTEAERIERWGTNWRDKDLQMESAEAAARRGLLAIADIVNNHPGERVLIVAHGTLLRLLIESMTETNDRLPLDNTSVSYVSKIDERWTCSVYNCTKHL